MIFTIAIILIAARWVAQLWLAALNQREVQRNAHRVPDAFASVMDPPTYAKSVAYTLAKSRLHRIEVTWDSLVLVAVLFSGLLPWIHSVTTERLGTTVWAEATVIFAIGAVLSVPGLPLEWFSQFRLEARFGFNTMTYGTWIMDHVKGFVLGVVLGYPLLVLVLAVVRWAGSWWWLLAWAVVMGFQLVLMVVAPAIIMPWFNKFTPLPEGTLKERLLALARRTGFRAASIQVMDGSRRSRHSNAFFTGLGRLRKIVLFDTLIQQLTEPELEAVLAHEIGHYQRRHIRKMVFFSGAGLLAGFYLISRLAVADAFPRAFGFSEPGIVPALILFGLLSGTITFWMTPLVNLWSRRFEYEADRYAADAMSEAASLIGALRKLTEKNLSNLTPHRIFSGFYYSHPTLAERERKLSVP